MVPIVALVISSFFEGFQWHLLTLIGIAISVRETCWCFGADHGCDALHRQARGSGIR
jgi:hypothetical protein